MDGATERPRADGREELTVLVRVEHAAAAREAGLDADAICDAALRAATAKARRAAWLARNREAMAEHDAWIEEHGLPLEAERLF